MLRFLCALALGALMIARPEDVPPPYAPWQPLQIRAETTFVSKFKVMRAASSPTLCVAALANAGTAIPAVAAHEYSAQCHIRGAVRPERLTRARMVPERMQCTIALRLAMWEHHALQPAARRHLGVEVAEITHFGAYSCRPLRTSRGNSTRMSQHATANAFDISGFVLSDGRRITLQRGWTGGEPEAAFLRDARDGLCDWFRVTLSPDYNALHADHFHVDQGPFMTCR